MLSLVFLALLAISSVDIATSQDVGDVSTRLTLRGSTCTTTRGREGICKPLADCPSLLNQAAKTKLEVSFLLQGDPCIHSQPSDACCPDGPLIDDVSASFSNEEDSLAARFGKKPPSVRPSNVNTMLVHANRKLLPEDKCGLVPKKGSTQGARAAVDEVPWLALLQFTDRKGKTSIYCGGSIISPRYILTAAHCVEGINAIDNGLKLASVRVGVWDIQSKMACENKKCSPTQELRVEKTIIHRGYKPRQKTQVHDIALLKLVTPIQFTETVKPICLPIDSVADLKLDTHELQIAGWGKRSDGKVQKPKIVIKEKAKVPVMNLETCNNYIKKNFNLTVQPFQMCAGRQDGRNSCVGDSGGPLMDLVQVGNITARQLRWFVVGVVSGGPEVCGQGKPGVYTRVGDYIGWILDNLTP